jgi:DNA-binding MarR family transcriptional regulator
VSQSERKKLEASSWFSVVRAYQECTRRYTQMLQSFDLTLTQFDVLNAIRSLDQRAMPKAIADHLVVTRGNVTGVLHRLQERGLLRTRNNEHDGRSFFCELTSSGKEVLDRARRATAVFIDQQLAPFSDDDLRLTERHMSKMRSHLQTIDPDTISSGIMR